MWSFYLPSFSKLCLFSFRHCSQKDPSEFRLIQHLSYLHGTSVNDNIPDAHSSVHYASISDAIAVLKSLGAGCFLAKTDIKSAFRIIPIHPSDFPLLGMKWDNNHMFFGDQSTTLFPKHHKQSSSFLSNFLGRC